MSYQLAYERQQARFQKQRERQLARLADPKLQAETKAKALAAQERQQEKLEAKLASPEYKQQQLEKAKLYHQKAMAKRIEKAKSPPPNKRNKVVSLKPSQKKVKTKGLKGRTPTALETRIQNRVGGLGCICCLIAGYYTTADQADESVKYVSLHHIDGRTKPFAHAKVLPLCGKHHNVAREQGDPELLFPIHGASKAWINAFGTEMEVLEKVYQMIGEEFPWECAA
jgi:hypothetical protein